jgi:hypothetical protein
MAAHNHINGKENCLKCKRIREDEAQLRFWTIICIVWIIGVVIALS